MKPLVSIAIFLAAGPLWGGVRIKVEVTDLKDKSTTQQELLLDANRLRVNTSGEGKKMSVFFLTDGGRNRMVLLDPNTNEYREMDEETMKQVSQQLQGAMAALQSQLQNMPPEQRARIEQMMRGRGLGGPAAAEAPKVVYTAQGSGSVNGFSCTKYEGMRGGEKAAELCAAKPSELHLNPSDFEVFEKMRDFASNLTAGLRNSPLANQPFMDLTQRGYDGFPVQQTMYSGGQPAIKMEIKSVDKASFSDADFSLGNAKKVDLIPGGRR